MTRELEIERVTSQNRAELIQACEVEDGHVLPHGATHLFRRDGQIVSALSLFSPVVMFWAHTKKMKARDSMDHLKRCRDMAALQNPNFLVTCSPESPYRPFLESHFGLRHLWRDDVFDYPKK